MEQFLKIQCPDCKTVLIVRRRDGKIVEVRKPILEDSTGDRFKDAELKVKREKDVIARKFEEAKEREKGKIDRLNKLFEEGLKRAKEEGGPPERVNPMDM